MQGKDDDIVADNVKVAEQKEDEDMQWLRAPPRRDEIRLQIGDPGKRQSLEEIVKDAHKKIDDLLLRSAAATSPCPELNNCTPPYQCGVLGRCQPLIRNPCFVDVSCHIGPE